MSEYLHSVNEPDKDIVFIENRTMEQNTKAINP